MTEVLIRAEYAAIAADIDLQAPCSVIPKPADQTLPTALRVPETGHRAGVRRGVPEIASIEEAPRLANDSACGLTASLLAAKARTAIRAAREIRAGTVTVNCYGEGDITTPFGGMKQCGFGGRDNGLHAHDP